MAMLVYRRVSSDIAICLKELLLAKIKSSLSSLKQDISQTSQMT